MKIGISSACLYPELTEHSVAFLLEHGVKTLEIFINTPSELEPHYLNELRRMTAGWGAEIVSLHPYSSGMEGFLFFTDYNRRFEDGVELYKQYFEAIQLLGGDIVVFHGAHREHKIAPDLYFERFGTLWDVAKSMGVRLCHENVERSLSRTPAFFKLMGQYLPDAQTVFDVKQAVRAGFSPLEMLDAMGDRVAHIHVSDNTPAQDCLAPGQGTMDISGLLQTLLNRGYTGALMVELYRNSYDKYSDLLVSHNYLNHLLFDLIKKST